MIKEQVCGCAVKRWYIFKVAIGILLLFCCLGPLNSFGQTTERVRELQSVLVPEDGCPIQVTGVRTALDVDPFDAPIDGKIYINYKNATDKTIDGVKFRIRFTDSAGGDAGTFQAPDNAVLGPGVDRTQKWKRDSVDPRAVAVKIRVLMVRFNDGSVWQSVKLQEAAQQGQQAGPGQEQAQ